MIIIWEHKRKELLFVVLRNQTFFFINSNHLKLFIHEERKALDKEDKLICNCLRKMFQLQNIGCRLHFILQLNFQFFSWRHDSIECIFAMYR